MCFHCAVSLHILTFYLTMTPNHRKHPRFGEGREQRGEKYLPQLQLEWNFDIRKELHMMLNDIFQTYSYYFLWILLGTFRECLAREEEGNLEKRPFSFISKMGRFYFKCSSGKSLSKKLPKFIGHSQPWVQMQNQIQIRGWNQKCHHSSFCHYLLRF